jgi:hypothetical protein
VKNQIVSIHHRRQVYREVNVYDTTIAVRRLVDRDWRVVSFVKLMGEGAEHPEASEGGASRLRAFRLTRRPKGSSASQQTS